MPNIDRRVARTHRLLSEALVALVNEKRYDDVSIRDITDRADIGYATFFRHFESKDDLMLSIFNRIISEIESLPDQHQTHSFEQEGFCFFQHVQENAALYRSILDSLPFARKLRDNIVGIVQHHLDGHQTELTNSVIPSDIAAQHMVSSILGLMDWWLENDMPYSLEKMANIYDRLILRATWYAMLSDNDMSLPWDNADST